MAIYYVLTKTTKNNETNFLFQIVSALTKNSAIAETIKNIPDDTVFELPVVERLSISNLEIMFENEGWMLVPKSEREEQKEQIKKIIKNNCDLLADTKNESLLLLALKDIAEILEIDVDFKGLK